MSAYEPPTVDLPEFDTVVFGANDEPLTLAIASRYFLRFPFAQGNETLKDINVQQITQTANYNFLQSGTSIISQSGTGTNQFKDTNIAGALTTREITQDINYNLNQSGTGIISQTGTGVNLLKGITASGVTTLNNQVFVNAQMTTRDIVQSANFSLSQSGNGIISQTGTGTNAFKDSTIPNLTVNTTLDVNGATTCRAITQDANFNLNQSGTGIISQTGTGTNAFKDSTIPNLTVNTTLDVNGATTCRAITQDANFNLNQSGTGIISQTGTGTNAFKDSTIPNLTVNTTLDVNGATTCRAITQDANFNLNQSGTGIISQLGTGTNLFKATTISGALSATTGDFNSITTGAIVMDIDTNITQSGTGIISQTGTGTNAFKDSTIPNLTVNTSLDVNGATTCRAITQDANFNLNQSGTGIISQTGTGTNAFKDSTIPNLTVNTSLDVNGATTCRAITQDANFNLNQSGTGIISQSGTGTNALKGTDFTGFVGQTITGSGNCQFGDKLSLSAITTGTDNVALGLNTLRLATTATSNVAIGSGALATKVSGVQCIAIGPSAMGSAVNNIANTIAIGAGAATFCGGNANVAIGINAQSTATSAFNSVAVGFGSLQNNNEYQTTAIGRESGRYGYGNNNVFLGYNTGQASTNFNAYTYLTCIGSGSGGTDADSNRIVLGSATGNEVLYLAGNPAIRSRDPAGNVQLFDNINTGSISIGNAITTGQISIGDNITLGSVTIADAMTSGSVSIADNSTGGSISIGSAFTPVSINSTNTTHTAAAGGTVQLSNGVTTGTTQIMKDGTTGNLELHNGSAAGNGRINVNRPIRLPTSTSFANPTSGELGERYAVSGVQTVVSGTIYTLATANLPTGIWNITVQVYAENTSGGNGTITRFTSAVSTTAANLTPVDSQLYLNSHANITVPTLSEEYWNYSISHLSAGSSGATRYLNGRLTFSSGTWDLNGYLIATRIA